jgi:hypothetical protein
MWGPLGCRQNSRFQIDLGAPVPVLALALALALALV